MGLVLQIEGQFPDADTEGAFVADVETLVKDHAADLTTATLSTDFSGAPELPVGEPVQALTISGSLTPATVGAPFHATLTAQGGTPPYVWLADGLVDGLNIDPDTGTITGTPNVAGAASIHVAVHDSTEPNPEIASADYPIIVAGPVSDEDRTQDEEIKELKAQLATVQSQLDKLLNNVPAASEPVIDGPPDENPSAPADPFGTAAPTPEAVPDQPAE